MIGVIHYAYGAPKSIDDVATYFSHILNGKTVPGPMLEKIEASFKKPSFPDFIASSTQRKKGVNIFPHDVYTLLLIDGLLAHLLTLSPF